MPDEPSVGFELFSAKVFVGPAGVRSGVPQYRLTVPSGEDYFGYGDKYILGDKTYKVSSLRGFSAVGDGVLRSVEVQISAPDGSVEKLYATIGEAFYNPNNMSPAFIDFYRPLAKEEPLMVADIKYVRREATSEWDSASFYNVREKIRSSMDLLFDSFKFPGPEEATLYVSSWFSPGGAKCILVGLPGSGKTTLVQSSTMIFMAEENRYNTALQYYQNSRDSKRFEEFRRDKHTEHGRYTVDGVPSAQFGPAEYLNMYRKNWSICPVCYSPDSDYIGASPIGDRVYLRCGYARCLGRMRAMDAGIVDEIGDKLDGEEQIPTRGEGVIGYREETRSFETKKAAEDYMELHRKKYLLDHCPSCNQVTSEGKKVCENCKATLPWPIFRVVPLRGGYVPVRYDYNKGYVFATKEYTPLYAEVKMSPDKHPDEVFYYTEIQKRVFHREVVGPGGEIEREIFDMPPKARPIVYANVKMFNEISRANSSVQDAILGLLEEGEVESKGHSFYTKRPFVAFFDLNPHKAEAGEAGMAIGKLDWAFVDRCDFSITMPTTSFPNKLDILREGMIGDTKGVIFEAMMRGGGHFTPLFRDELERVRNLIRTVEVDDEANFVLALVSDLYARTYVKYLPDSPEFKARQATVINPTMADPFLDISTTQYFGPYFKDGQVIDKGRRAKEVSNIASGAAVIGLGAGGSGLVKRFMDIEAGKMIDRPLSMRVCISATNLAKARAWLLEVCTPIRNPVHGIVRPPKMEVVTRNMNYSQLGNILGPFLTTPESRRLFSVYISRLPKTETLYQLLECPECGESLPSKDFMGVRESRACPGCNYEFIPLFKVVVKPEDFIAVFPACAAMRFNADYNAEHIPKSVSDIFSNTLAWLRAEIKDLWENEYKTYMPDSPWRKFIDAYVSARRPFLIGGISDEERKKRLDDVLSDTPGSLASDSVSGINNDYPYYYQALRFFHDVAHGMLDKRFGVPPRGGTFEVSETGQKMGDVQFTTKDGKTVTKERHAWDKDV